MDTKLLKNTRHFYCTYIGIECLGIELDEPGWWSQNSYDEFNARAQCVADAYQSLVVNELPGKQNIDGNLTLDENLADIGGNRLAYFAYSKFIIEIFISLINHF